MTGLEEMEQVNEFDVLATLAEYYRRCGAITNNDLLMVTDSMYLPFFWN